VLLFVIAIGKVILRRSLHCITTALLSFIVNTSTSSVARLSGGFAISWEWWRHSTAAF